MIDVAIEFNDTGILGAGAVGGGGCEGQLSGGLGGHDDGIVIGFVPISNIFADLDVPFDPRIDYVGLEVVGVDFKGAIIDVPRPGPGILPVDATLRGYIFGCGSGVLCVRT